MVLNILLMFCRSWPSWRLLRLGTQYPRQKTVKTLQLKSNRKCSLSKNEYLRQDSWLTPFSVGTLETGMESMARQVPPRNLLNATKCRGHIVHLPVTRSPQRQRCVCVCGVPHNNKAVRYYWVLWYCCSKLEWISELKQHQSSLNSCCKYVLNRKNGIQRNKNLMWNKNILLDNFTSVWNAVLKF